MGLFFRRKLADFDVSVLPVLLRRRIFDELLLICVGIVFDVFDVITSPPSASSNSVSSVVVSFFFFSVTRAGPK